VKSNITRFSIIVLMAVSVWGIEMLLVSLQVARSTAGMALLLAVLAIATRGDWWLAMISAGTGCLAFNYYYIDSVNSFAIRTVDGAVTFSAVVITAITGSHLAIRARRRADEADRRREETTRLHQLSAAMLSADTIAETGRLVVRRIVELFGAQAVMLRIADQEFAFGEAPATACPVRLHIRSGPQEVTLSLYGIGPSAEVTDALASLVDLALDRATASEDRARMETVQRGEELRNTVLNALAHDFKTPLTCIKAAASMLRRSSDVDSPEGRDLVIAIDEEADRLTTLISESLDLARIEAHRMNPRSEICDVRELVDRVTGRMARYLSGRNLRIEIPAGVPAVQGDRLLLEQMLIQVLDNAWKYSKAGAAILVHVSFASQRVFITIQNEGGRIPAADCDRIFEKFYRGSAHRSAVEGTGLGLAIARSIAEVHGGTLWLDQEIGGPAFRFLLPSSSLHADSDNRVEITSDPQPHYLAY
jgi:two-component system sensor histidine kinase KdpD